MVTSEKRVLKSWSLPMTNGMDESWVMDVAVNPVSTSIIVSSKLDGALELMP